MKTNPRPHTVCVVGIGLGDEGKGRVIDNLIGKFLKTRGITGVTVIRFQGGSNSGHTVEAKGIHLALHQIPCSVFYVNATGIMDRGMSINPVDLVDEIHLVEKHTGSLRGRLFLSQEAILNTDLERAEELLNRMRQGKAGGGTGRGIGPSYAHHYDRLGFHIYDIIDKNWEKTLGDHHDRYAKEFSPYGMNLSTIEVPDFLKTKKTGKEHKRTVGTKQEFFRRIGRARSELIKRNMVVNTFVLHEKLFGKKSEAILFEGAQALGLHPWLGTLPDITASDTSTYGIHTGTAFWKIEDIDRRIGIFKIPYTSSVGARTMTTEADEAWAKRVRDEAHEYGTTTGRPRDILYLDLPFLRYNIRMSGVHELIGTHLDISWEGVPIKVCIQYNVPYQPGLRYQKDVIPQYVFFPGWDGEKVRQAKTFKELPAGAKKFLAFLEKKLQTPIVAVTTGPTREHYIDIHRH